MIHPLYKTEAMTLIINSATKNESEDIAYVLKKGIVHFFFCLEGELSFQFSPHYARTLQTLHNYFFYHPDQELSFTLQSKGAGKWIVLEISLEELHRLFVHENLPFLQPEAVKQKYYDEREISSPLLVVLKQLYGFGLNTPQVNLYYQGKILELLSLYFRPQNSDKESCPFLNNDETVKKLKFIRSYILEHLHEPLTLRDLSKLGGINEFQLKMGFKKIYGKTVFSYMLDHRLEEARRMLESRQLTVSEVAEKVGYNNTSHFIAAYKKKFSLTPKQYVMKVA